MSQLIKMNGLDVDTADLIRYLNENLNPLTLAKFGINQSGNLSLIGNGISAPLPTRSGIPTVTIIGDSIGSEFALTAACTSATYDAASGVATLTFAAAFNIKAGDVVDVVNMADSAYDTFDTPVLSASGTGPYVITYRPVQVPAGASSGATLSYTWQLGSYIGILSDAKFLSGARFNFKTRAIGGSTIAPTIARFDRDVPPTNPHVVLLSIGANDFYTAGASVATLIAGLATLKAKCDGIGAKFGIITPPPQGSGRVSWSAANLKKQLQYNAAAKIWGLANGCPVFDSATSSSGTLNYLNPADASGNPNTGFSIDAVHPSTLGKRAIAKRIAAWIQQWCPPRDFLVASAAEDLGGAAATNLINGLFSGVGGSGADSGSVATNWTVSKPAGTATVAASIAARTIAADGDTCGNNQVLTISAASANAQVQIAHSSAHASVANGDNLDTGLHLQVSGATDLKFIYVYILSQTVTTGNKQFYYFPNAGSNAYAIPEDYSGVIDLPVDVRTPQATHGAPSGLTMNVIAVFGASGTGAATIKIGRGTLRIKV